MRIWLLPMILLLAGCSATTPPQTAGAVDLQRYQGTWYEVARLPMFFQRHCAQSEANYLLQADDSLLVANSCRSLEGETLHARGQAVLQPGHQDRLWVHFDNWFSNLFPRLTRGEYWILAVDADYQTALVGHPDRKYLWLLAREPQVSPQTRERMLGIAERQGYATDELIWRRVDAQLSE